MGLFQKIRKKARKLRRRAKLKTDPTRFGKGGGGGGNTNAGIPPQSISQSLKVEKKTPGKTEIAGMKLPKWIKYAVIGVVVLVGGFFAFFNKKKKRR